MESLSSLLISSLYQTFLILIKTLPVIFITLIITGFLVKRGYLTRIFYFTTPLISRIGLPAETSAAFIASFGSGLSAGTILTKLYSENKITGPQMILAAQVNTLPVFIRETFTRFIPVIIPILGLLPGLIYTAAFIFSGLFKLLLIIIAGVFLKRFSDKEKLHEDNDSGQNPEVVHGALTFHELRLVSLKAVADFIRIAKLMVIATFIITAASEAGLLSAFENMVGPFIAFIGMPEKMAAPVLAYVGHSTAGGYIIGAMYKSGSIDLYIAAVSALAGNMLSFPMYLIRSSMARNMAIYGARFGVIHVVITLTTGLIARFIFLFIVITAFRYL